MVTVDTSEFYEGLSILVDGEPYTIIWFQHHKPGKGGAVMRTKLKHLRTGAIVERTFKSGETFEEIKVERKKKTYLYNDGDTYYFMDEETYEQIPIDKKVLGKAVNFLTENSSIDVIYLENEIIGVELPPTVVLRVVATVPGVRGDTVSASVMKPATVETGAVVQVPLFIKENDMIRIDTVTGEYVERVSEGEAK
jgi:elongation factor P